MWDNEYTKMPEQLLVNARVSNDLYANSEQAAANLSVPIALHKESLAKTGDTPQINKSLTIAGQSYDINMILDERFTDGKGGAHTINYDDFNLYSHIVDITQENSPTQYYINLGSEALPQPLTFKINSYPNPIKENVSLFIRK
ncbi:hypothetical protein [Paenibacillus graminis]|nr:hypothetical protein [Paenibacillus graminis]MEC0168812.1 hypothetical protein [Paenibacillus graminis]